MRIGVFIGDTAAEFEAGMRELTVGGVITTRSIPSILSRKTIRYVPPRPDLNLIQEPAIDRSDDITRSVTSQLKMSHWDMNRQFSC